jgi:HPt (histidine-containing phosphotransfer) domain-containing protein
MTQAGVTEGAFDKQAALKRLGGSVELLKDMFQFFLEDAPALLATLDSSLSQKNLDEAFRAAHSLKGLASNFDAHVVTRPAKQIEELLRNNDFAGAQRLSPEVRAGVEASIAAGKAVLDQPDAQPVRKSR